MNWIKKTDSKILISILLLLIVINVITYFTSNNLLMHSIELLFTLPFLIYFFYKFAKTSLALTGFLIFALLGNLLNVFEVKFYAIHIEVVAYVLAYLCLIYEVTCKLSKIKINKLIGAYLIIVFAVNCYFLFSFFGILKTSVNNNAELSIIAARVASLFILSLLAFLAYLNSETKQSIIFLAMSICLVFSDIMYFVTKYYIYDLSLSLVSKMLYVLTIFCFYKYVLNSRSSSTETHVESSIIA